MTKTAVVRERMGSMAPIPRTSESLSAGLMLANQ